MTLFTPPHLLNPNRWRGMRIGLLGGSFNPPHEGHVHVSETAMKRLNLDCVWWIVSPGNPLKPKTDYLPYEERLTLCQKITKNPCIIISDLERQTGTTRTVETVVHLLTDFPHTSFVWLAGTDIVSELPRWYRWADLPDLIAMAFVARPPAVDLVRDSAIRRQFKVNRFVSSGSKEPLTPRKCFWLLHDRLNENASSKIRKNR